jgi:hypothetical protein
MSMAVFYFLPHRFKNGGAWFVVHDTPTDKHCVEHVQYILYCNSKLFTEKSDDMEEQHAVSLLLHLSRKGDCYSLVIV